MHDYAGSLYSIGFPCFHDFSHGESHPYIPIHSIEHLFHNVIITWFVYSSYAHAYMRASYPYIPIHSIE